MKYLNLITLILISSSASVQAETPVIPQPNRAFPAPPLPSPSLPQNQPNPFDHPDAKPSERSEKTEIFECQIKPISYAWADQIATPDQFNDAEANENRPETITIERFTYLGNTVFGEKELNKQFEDKGFFGKPIGFAELQEAIGFITKYYNDRGYINSYAILLPQNVQDNKIITIGIIEGGLATIRIIRKGDGQRLNPRYICSRLELVAQPLNRDQLLEKLQLLQLNPLIGNISVNLSEGMKPESSILEVEITEAKSFSIEPLLDNARSPSVGSFRRQLLLSEGNVTGWGDRLNLAYTNTDGSNAIESRYTLPLTSRNMTLNLAGGYSWNNVIEKPFNQADITGNSSYWEIGLRQPLIERPTQELAIGIKFLHQASQTSILGENYPLSRGADDEGKTKISSVDFFQEYTHRSNRDLWAFRSEFSVGVNLFDATINQTEPDSNFVLWRGQTQWLRLLAPDTILLVKGSAQIADRALVPLNQFGLGGLNSVRGYRQDQILSDNGIFGSIELQYPIIGKSHQSWGVLQIAPFIDAGTVWASEDDTDLDPSSLVSIGTGLRWQKGDRFLASIYFGIPLISAENQEKTWQENGLYFSINSKFSF